MKRLKYLFSLFFIICFALCTSVVFAKNEVSVSLRDVTETYGNVCQGEARVLVSVSGADFESPCRC